MSLDPTWIKAQLDEIRASTDGQAKGAQFERLLRVVLDDVAGLKFLKPNVKTVYGTQEIDLAYWNAKPLDGLHFLDCPLFIEGKSSSSPVDGRDFEHFANTVKHRGRRDGILVAMGGLTGEPSRNSAGLYHQSAALIEGITILVITGEDLEVLHSGADFVALCQRVFSEITLGQVQSRPAKPKFKPKPKPAPKPKPKLKVLRKPTAKG